MAHLNPFIECLADFESLPESRPVTARGDFELNSWVSLQKRNCLKYFLHQNKFLLDLIVRWPDYDNYQLGLAKLNTIKCINNKIERILLSHPLFIEATDDENEIGAHLRYSKRIVELLHTIFVALPA